jgi:transcriptional regulator GlxA family with amidase domain
MWWDLESQLRRDLRQPIDLALLQRLSRRSMRTIVRACHEALGVPPMHRVKQIRMSMGRGLVWHSDWRFSEIAARIGYPRVQEFSRDYHLHFGLTPSADRKAGPDYQRVRSRTANRARS